MKLPYSDATSGTKAIDEMQKILRAFGCTTFGYMIDDAQGVLMVQFVYRERKVSLKASYKGYAAAWLKENPWTNRKTVSKVQWERKALDQGAISVYSILRDLIKGQITAVECGILSFEGAFLGSILLPSGETVLERIEARGLLAGPGKEEIDL